MSECQGSGGRHEGHDRRHVRNATLKLATATQPIRQIAKVLRKSTVPQKSRPDLAVGTKSPLQPGLSILPCPA